ncbi:uncharacterized protein LOC114289556 [Camellia sinensis]|uniref:uncharacterized protein LOC114289556 n=1 Tax=Camellia sinensis TaxID=4442 RepID=UPI001036AD02|nr:uncharacterized protein LOC114289556 [Camellia sinensis]
MSKMLSLMVIFLRKSICNLPLGLLIRLISSYDSSLFVRTTPPGTTLLLFYVDDMIITGDDVAGIFSLKQFLNRQFEMKDLGTLNYFLELEISHDSNSYYLSQAKYASDRLACAGLTDCKTISTLVDPQTRLIPLDGDLLFDATLYRLLVGSLVYLILHAFSDADWTGDPTNRRSTMGFYFFLGDSLLTWRSKK